MREAIIRLIQMLHNQQSSINGAFAAWFTAHDSIINITFNSQTIVNYNIITGQVSHNNHEFVPMITDILRNYTFGSGRNLTVTITQVQQS